MAEYGEENTPINVFGGVDFENDNQQQEQNVGTIRNEELPTTRNSFWERFKAFWLQEIDWNKEIKVELTPHQQKIEDEINEFLNQEITWEKVRNFLFQDVKFGKNN